LSSKTTSCFTSDDRLPTFFRFIFIFSEEAVDSAWDDETILPAEAGCEWIGGITATNALEGGLEGPVMGRETGHLP